MPFGINTPGGPLNIALDGAQALQRGVTLTTCTFEFWDPFVSQERLKLESPVQTVWTVHSMQPSPNYFDVLLSFIMPHVIPYIIGVIGVLVSLYSYAVALYENG